LFGSYVEPCKSNRVLNHLSAKEESEDKFEQLYSVEFKDPFSRTISMSVEDGIALSTISNSVQRLLSLGGFNLTKWTSNSVEVLEFIPEEDRVEGNIIVCESDETSKRTLGIGWDVRTDELCFKVHEFHGNPTRGNILSYVASVFDPLGFVAPIILPAKVVLQDTCRRKLDWDVELPIDCQAKWNIWCRHIKELDHLRIPRCLKPGFEPSSAQIHCSADASELAYGVVAYIRYESVSGQIHCLFLLAKSRFAPLKLVTIPRMEFTACVLCAKIGRHVREQLSILISSVIYWTDSTVVLHCTKNMTKRFERRLINNMLSKRNGNRLTLGALSAEDIENSKSDIITLVQTIAFPAEKRVLNSSPLMLGDNTSRQQKGQEAMDEVVRRKKLIRQSSIRDLNPFMLEGKIRVEGRLQLSCLPFETKYPIIFPNNHFVTDMIIMHYHLINAHVGVTQTLSSIRGEYWIVRGYSTVRKVLKRCYLCRRLYPTPCSRIMAPLPEYRAESHSPPFSQVGVDYFGPFYPKQGRVVEKRYGCLFICLSIKAVHIEMAYSLDTDSFLCALWWPGDLTPIYSVRMFAITYSHMLSEREP
uniref:Integrase_H2C2 domain-containing protein n=1 Tax=Schistosoma curassoni TaxID=6186 RepID=A0A183JQR5_9TREM